MSMDFKAGEVFAIDKPYQISSFGALAHVRYVLSHELGYKVVPVKVLKAINYRVPQKRERLILVGIRKDIKIDLASKPEIKETIDAKNGYLVIKIIK